MLAFVLLTVVLIVMGLLVAWSGRLVELLADGGALASGRNRVLTLAGCIVVVAVLAVAYRSASVARPDGKLIERIAVAPDSAIAQLMTYVTLLGDTVPSYLIATALAVVVFRQGIHRILCWVLPVLVLAELYIQLGIWKVLDDTTIGQLHPDTPIGGDGKIPSGSVARLLSLFLFAAVLWQSHSRRGAVRLVTVGAVLTIVQTVSRLALGRHLLADLVAGVALGVFLAVLASLLVSATAGRRRPRPLADPQPIADPQP